METYYTLNIRWSGLSPSLPPPPRSFSPIAAEGEIELFEYVICSLQYCEICRVITLSIVSLIRERAISINTTTRFKPNIRASLALTVYKVIPK